MDIEAKSETTIVAPQTSGLHIDRSVGIGLIIAILGQMFVGVWYASAAMDRISDNQRRIAALEASVAAIQVSREETKAQILDRLADITERVARIEVSTDLLTGHHREIGVR